MNALRRRGFNPVPGATQKHSGGRHYIRSIRGEIEVIIGLSLIHI